MKSAGFTAQLSEVGIFSRRRRWSSETQNNKNLNWETVQLRKSKRKECKSQPSEKPSKLSPKPTQKKPRRSTIRPDALINFPKNKERIIQKYCPESRQSCPADRPSFAEDHCGHTLTRQKNVINTGLEEDLEIHGFDTTTRDDVISVLQKQSHINTEMTNYGELTIPPGIWSWKLPFQSAVNNDSAGFVAVTVDGIRFCNCCAPPSLSIVDFTDFLDQLTKDAKQHYSVVIAGYFTCWADDWGCEQTNTREKALLDAFSTLDIVLLNSGDTLTRNDQESNEKSYPGLRCEYELETSHEPTPFGALVE
ncbi:hypothetical protein EVAR_82619_1 [Eumeta japonica]|uniref:Endonuclease/exonuclease/phosphatase domain-containing protein n=1 Tax=Eumeta variegata TaxID=151549 RepID=A0A4C1X2P8_EUMVA|nr:hypothetical protein EVAR_82619_1 [Eumeta japonica]